MTKFRHLPAAGRAIIVAVAIGVLAIAVVACATSYNAIYRLVTDLGLYGYRPSWSASRPRSWAGSCARSPEATR